MITCTDETQLTHYNKGPSEKGTTSLQGALPISPKEYMQYISTFERRTQRLVPKCPLFGGLIINKKTKTQIL